MKNLHKLQKNIEVPAVIRAFAEKWIGTTSYLWVVSEEVLYNRRSGNACNMHGVLGSESELRRWYPNAFKNKEFMPENLSVVFSK